MAKTFKQGDKVRENRQGAKVETVLKQVGNSIWTYESNTTLHISKAVRVSSANKGS